MNNQIHGHDIGEGILTSQNGVSVYATPYHDWPSTEYEEDHRREVPLYCSALKVAQALGGLEHYKSLLAAIQVKEAYEAAEKLDQAGCAFGAVRALAEAKQKIIEPKFRELFFADEWGTNSGWRAAPHAPPEFRELVFYVCTSLERMADAADALIEWKPF